MTGCLGSAKSLPPRKSTHLTSHDETIAGLSRSLKDDAPRRRTAAAGGGVGGLTWTALHAAASKRFKEGADAERRLLTHH